ncbi:MAG: 4-hydroxybenzoate octaprenyltransferase [Pseudomonadales bacterium]|jgi:4-hydroxybenzoate polyprenyltransferase
MLKRYIPANYLPYYQLMRIDRPIGTLLLLWPTYMALFLAAGGFPSWKNLAIFTLGVFLMRSAGCVINDYADRNVDGHVARTSQRPLASGAIKASSALKLFAALIAMAFIVVLLTNQFTVLLSVGALLLASAYPFMKRYTHLPQVVLGAAFAWAVPMAFAAELNTVPPEAWLLYAIVVLWAVIYDTFYAMADYEDDLKIGVKSTAVLFGPLAPVIILAMQVGMIAMLLLLAHRFELGAFFTAAIVIAAGLFGYQQLLVRGDSPKPFEAFLNNHWVGLVLFVGIVLALLL